MKIYAFHLLNDYSGSPKVLRQTTWRKDWIQNGIECHIVTCSGREGFLSEIKGGKISPLLVQIRPESATKVDIFNVQPVAIDHKNVCYCEEK
jgi:hypothetical protein